MVIFEAIISFEFAFAKVHARGCCLLETVFTDSPPYVLSCSWTSKMPELFLLLAGSGLQAALLVCVASLFSFPFRIVLCFLLLEFIFRDLVSVLGFDSCVFIT